MKPKITDGFTLIELMASTALAALFMVAVLAIIGSLGRGQKSFAAKEQNADWWNGVIETVRNDMRNSTRVQWTSDGFELHGCASIEKETGEATARPTTVAYSVRNIGNRHWLVRTQHDELDDRREQVWRELVCPDVQQIDLQLLRADESKKVDAQQPREGLLTNGVRLRIESSRANLQPVEKVLWLR